MKKTIRKGAIAAAVATVCVAGTCAVALAAGGADALGNILGGNDTAVRGTYTAYDPAVEAEHTGGVAIEGSEEEELQQERIAGGAVGEVVSQNLEPLDGIVNEDKNAYVPTFGLNFQAPDVPQAIVDAVAAGTLDGLPKDHLTAQLTPEECATCHAIV